MFITGIGTLSSDFMAPDEGVLFLEARNVFESDFDRERMAFIKDRDLDLDWRSSPLLASDKSLDSFSSLTVDLKLGLLIEPLGGKW